MIFQNFRQKSVSPTALIVVSCLIEALSMMTLATFPSLIPVFQGSWGLTNTEAGTISGIYFAGELVSVTIVTALMDRWDGRPIFLAGLVLGVAAAAGFALSDGFWSASFWRFLQGAAVGVTYMPGLKILTDHLPRKYLSRGISFYTATYYVAAGASFFLALQTQPMIGWQGTFIIAAAGPLIGLILAALYIPPSPPPAVDAPSRGGIFDFREAFKNRKAVGFSILYGLHNMELVAFSSWLVPFFVFSQSTRPAIEIGSIALFGVLAAIISMAALPSSILFNELAHRVGRQKLIAAVSLVSATMGILFVFSAGMALWVGVVAAIIFSMAIAADSAALSGGVIIVSDPVHKGRTMSIYSFVGFTGGFVGPMIFGTILDLSGGETEFGAWLTAFVCIGALVLLAPLIIWRWIGYAEPIR